MNRYLLAVRLLIIVVSPETTVTEIKISQDQLETIQRILGSKFLWSIKKDRLLALTGLKQLLCCVCGQINSRLYEVRYSGPDYVKFEVYCVNHIATYTKNKDKTNLEIAESFGIQLAEPDRTPPLPWD